MEWNEPLYSEGSGAAARVGVLLCHGFTGSPRSLQEWAGRFAGVGHTVALPLLSGHGRDPEALESAVWTQWTADVEKAFIWLRERTGEVFVCGLSMGGALALWLAAEHAEIAGIITVNAAVRDPRESLVRAIGRVGHPRWAKAVGNDTKLAGVDERAYDRVPMRGARQYVLLLAEVRRRLSLVQCPALIFSSTVDHVVPPANQQEIYDSISSETKALVKLENSYHVATMDNDKEIVFERSLAFVATHSEIVRHAGAQGGSG